MTNTYRVTLDLEDNGVYTWEGQADDATHAEGLAIAELAERPKNDVQVESASTQQLNLYRVRAATTTYCHLEVNAVDADEAIEIGKNTDGGSFTPDHFEGDWNVLSATEVVPPTRKPTPLAARGAEGAHRALNRYLEEAGEPEFAVRDLLTDLRHYCDQYGLDIGTVDTNAHTVYVEELAEDKGE